MGWSHPICRSPGTENIPVLDAQGSPEFPFLLLSCGVIFPQMNSNPLLLF